MGYFAYAAFGREIRRRFSTPLGETKGRGNAVTLKLRRPARIGHVHIMEDIAHGERVRSYKIEAHTGASDWTTLAEAQSIGHKRIHRFAPVEVAAVRLTVVQSTAEPIVRSLAAFAT